MDAYLVLHRGSRWTDVYRLAPPSEVVLGRSSENQVVLRSGRASRRHARLACDETSWFIEDLGSRNGVFVNDSRIAQATRLSEGDRLQVAGFEMRFTHDLTHWSGSGPSSSERLGQNHEDDATQDDLMLGDDFASEADAEWLDIVSRSPASTLGMSGQRNSGTETGESGKTKRAGQTGQPRSPGETSRPDSRTSLQRSDGSSSDLSLLQMAFAMGRLESPADDFDPAAELLIQTLAGQLPAAEIGLYFFDSDRELPMPRHVHQREGHRYRRPPESLVRQIRFPGASALLARNVVGDRRLATEDTRGEIDVESIVLVPLSLPTSEQDDSDNGSSRAGGLLHVITTAGDPSLGERDLAMIVTACEIFCEACRSLVRRQQLEQTLHQSRETIRRLRKQLAGRVEILGRSDKIADVQYQIAQVARSGAAVLLRGESGTGKELVASAIHFASPRADEPMVCLNCAALSKDLLESELFGHEKGAFTGATEQKKGKFEAASGGTLMLDEIGEMNLDLQAKLLRVLEGHPFERVGGHTAVHVDVRVIAATHRDLQAMVQAGTFRQDLFYRLNVIEIIVPPLRERGRDVVLLAEHFVNTFVQTMGRGPMKLTREASQKLLEYSWPGNVRELRNVIERAVVMAPLDVRGLHEIGPDELMLTRAVHGSPTPSPTGAGSISMAATSSPTGPNGSTPAISLAELERKHIERVLNSTGGNKSQSATILGIERSTLDRKLKRYAAEDSKSD
ncbi:sigma 54-interacting transcriptional regulator [Aporhodopirellula aestuarii]|uniref:Sigma 54-interacting transcriptional regulator n=1 Tax=Aporhodopirellula aestuarii TaxID=2950107 RepID=A0ABT0U5Y3_9BACT|nr:sigma 54-interacting transcriptional regulator [Aporhodopirellula aestuarii]MCM2372069.1 sigma 54-interacting transcriptional regulator [Aporhodopirellula aestuarii]